MPIINPGLTSNYITTANKSENEEIRQLRGQISHAQKKVDQAFKKASFAMDRNTGTFEADNKMYENSQNELAGLRQELKVKIFEQEFPNTNSIDPSTENSTTLLIKLDTEKREIEKKIKFFTENPLEGARKIQVDVGFTDVQEFMAKHFQIGSGRSADLLVLGHEPLSTKRSVSLLEAAHAELKGINEEIKEVEKNFRKELKRAGKISAEQKTLLVSPTAIASMPSSQLKPETSGVYTYTNKDKLRICKNPFPDQKTPLKRTDYGTEFIQVFNSEQSEKREKAKAVVNKEINILEEQITNETQAAKRESLGLTLCTFKNTRHLQEIVTDISIMDHQYSDFREANGEKIDRSYLENREEASSLL